MNPKAEQDQLLADIMTESMPADVREALLDETLRVVRFRRRRQKAFRGMAVMAALAMITLWLDHSVRKQSPMPVAIERAYELVETHPLSATVLVHTQPMKSNELAVDSTLVVIVHTRLPDSDFIRINDDELLAMVSPRPAILVRNSPTSERLVFANPQDEEGFPAN